MGLLQEATVQTAFAKIGIYGSEGSGKTRTATEIATGIGKKTNKSKIAFFDTETGSDFMIPLCKSRGMTLYSIKSRSFKTLCQYIYECEKEGVDIMIIDSITHVWRELCETYKKDKRKYKLTMMDWGILKSQWAMFTDIYLNSKVHIILLGRAGNEYDMRENEDEKLEIMKVGTKMKVEGEFGYEPSLLLEMSKIKKSAISKNLDDKGFVNRCHVLKDRSDTINGEVFDYPVFENFLSFFAAINIGGEHLGVDLSDDSSDLFKGINTNYEKKKKAKAILVETLSDTLVKHGLNGRSDQAQKDRVHLLEEIFGTSSKTAIENLNIEELEEGIRKINERYASVPLQVDEAIQE